MKKIILIIFGIVLISGNFAMAENNGINKSTETKKNNWNKLTPLERAKRLSAIKGSRKINIKPVKQKDGIKTGCVMAYGHIIPPPYKVKYEGRKLIINGVQIEPSLVVQREYKPIVITDEKRQLLKSTMKLERQIRKKFWQLCDEKKRNIKEIKSEIIDFAKKHELVSDAEWKGDKTLRIVYKEIGSVLISLNPDMPKQHRYAAAPIKSKSKKVKKDRIKQIKNGLSLGNFYIFADGLMQVSGMYVFPVISKIMQNTNLTEDERFEQLKKILHFDATLYVMENYDFSKWQNSGCIPE